MSLFGGPREGEHVVARRDLSTGFIDGVTGAVTVKKGKRGIVRRVRSGLFSTRYDVEFDDGWMTRTIEVPGRDLRTAMFGHGEESWEKRRDRQVGARLGLFLAFGLVPLIATVRYFLAGGSVDGLLGAIVTESVAMVLDLVAWLGPLPVLALLGVALLLARRTPNG